MSIKLAPQATRIQVIYRKRPEDTQQETELFKFQSAECANKFLVSIAKNPDVEKAQKL